MASLGDSIQLVVESGLPNARCRQDYMYVSDSIFYTCWLAGKSRVRDAIIVSDDEERNFEMWVHAIGCHELN